MAADLKSGYLLSIWYNGDVFFDAQWPVDVEFILIQLEEEHNKDKERVEHEESKERFIPQFL